jgi:hypothetical protein
MDLRLIYTKADQNFSFGSSQFDIRCTNTVKPTGKCRSQVKYDV